MSLGRRSARILVVDDDPNMLQVIRWTLEDEGFAVTGATGGDQAVAAASAARPDVVVLDFGLPPQDGATVAVRLREVTANAGLPIVLVTADGRASEKALRCGAVAYLHKPFDADELIAAVSQASTGGS